MASLMDGNRPLLVWQERVGRLSPSKEEAVPGIGEIPRGAHVPARQVGQVGPGEPRRAASDGLEVDVRAELLALRVYGKDRRALPEVRQGDLDLPVEPTRPKQGREI